MPSPSLRTKLVFWMLLGALSLLLAEVFSGSSLFPFTEAWGLLVTYPLYTLHTLVLAALIFRQRRVTLPTLFLAGAIFGMYEAYVTKVLWNPTWGEAENYVGGIVLVQTSILILFYHPLMSFILPLVIGEQMFTASSETTTILNLQSQSRRAWLRNTLFAVYCGIYHGQAASDVLVSLLSLAVAGLGLGVLTFIWHRISREQHYTLRMLLPSGKQTTVLTIILLLNYAWQTILIRPEALPQTLTPHLTVWAIYLFLIILLIFNLRKSPPYEAPTSSEPLTIRWQMITRFWLILTVTSLVFVFLKPLAFVIILLSWAVGVCWGLWLIARSIISALRPASPTI